MPRGTRGGAVLILVVGPGDLLHAAGPAGGGTTAIGSAAHGYPLGAAGCLRDGPAGIDQCWGPLTQDTWMLLLP